jgi:hypothetical protein
VKIFAFRRMKSELQISPLRSARDDKFIAPNKLVISTGGVMGLRPTQGDEKRLLSEATLPWKHRPHLCHLDRSEAQWRDLCVDAPSWKCFSTERIEGTRPIPFAPAMTQTSQGRLKITHEVKPCHAAPGQRAVSRNRYGPTIAVTASSQTAGSRPNPPGRSNGW